MLKLFSLFASNEEIVSSNQNAFFVLVQKSTSKLSTNTILFVYLKYKILANKAYELKIINSTKAGNRSSRTVVLSVKWVIVRH